MRLNNTKNNDIKVLALGVASAPRTLVLGGIAWILGGIGRQSDVKFVGLSDKIGSEIASDPKQSLTQTQNYL